MKNFLLLFSAVVMSLVACDRFEMEDVKTYRAVVETFDATRTSLGEGNKIVWSSDDLISVFENNENASRYQVASSSAGNPEASFVLMEEGKNGAEIGADIAVYPFSQSLECSRLSTGDYRVSGLSVPSVQQYSSEGFAPGNFPMMAVSEAGADNFAFKNACGILKLSLTGTSRVKSISVKGNSGEILSGPFKMSSSLDGTPAVAMEADAVAEVSLDCGQDGVLLDPDVPVPFMIVLPPVSFPKGFTVSVKSTDGAEQIRKTEKAQEIKRSTILNMPAVEFRPEYDDVLQVIIDPLTMMFNEMTIRVEVRNAKEYSGGYILKSDFNLAAVAKEANWKIAPRISDSFLYEGPLAGFPLGGESAPVSAGQTYVVWVAPYAEGQKLVTADDIVYKEFTVPQLLPGGSANPVSIGFQPAMKSMEVNLYAPGASMVLSALLTDNEYSKLTSENARIDYLLANAEPVLGSEMTVVRSGLSPGTPLTLLAFAVDGNGRYGDLLIEKYETAVPVFNDAVKIDLDVTYSGKTAAVNVSATGAEIVRYYYFSSLLSSSAWKRFLGGSLQTAENYLAVNNDSYPVKNTDDDPFVDGALLMESIEYGEEYVVVVMAVDSQGRLSRAHMTTFIPQMNLGNFVCKLGDTASKWQKSKPSVSFGDCYDNAGFYLVNWAVTPADGMTAYAVCAHPNAMEGYTTPEQLAIRVYNLGEKVVPGQMNAMLYGDKGNMVYVTWCDKDGNFYEVYSETVPQN